MIDEIRFRYNTAVCEHVMTRACRDALRAADRVMALDCLKDIMWEAKQLYDEILIAAPDKSLGANK